MTALETATIVGTVSCPPSRPATASEVWIDLLTEDVGVGDLLLVDGIHQQIIGKVVEMRLIEPRTHGTAHADLLVQRKQVALAKLALLGFSDDRPRLPQGTEVRPPRIDEVANLLAEARRIPEGRRVPVGCISVGDDFTPVSIHLDRVVGPIATTALYTGAAGSLKSSAGMLLAASIAHVTDQRCAVVIVNTKGNDFVFADLSREFWAGHLALPALRVCDRAMYAAMGFATPPVFSNAMVFVPSVHNPEWRSARPSDFPRTKPYRLSYASGVRYALAPTDDDEKPTSIITRQCIEEVCGAFAREHNITTLSNLVTALEAEFLAMTTERSRWRNQFQATTVSAALRQLRTTDRDVGPLLGDVDEAVAFPVETLAEGGTWIVDVGPLPQRGAQAVLDQLTYELWQAKANGTIPHEMPLVLLVDELNRWSSVGPTAARLAAIARDQRHRRFTLIGLAQQLSTLHPQLLANADTISLGTTKSSELIAECYNHLPVPVRSRLHRLPPGHRIIDAWPLAEPLDVETPFPSWLIGDEGLQVVDRWRANGQPKARNGRQQ